MYTYIRTHALITFSSLVISWNIGGGVAGIARPGVFANLAVGVLQCEGDRGGKGKGEGKESDEWKGGGVHVEVSSKVSDFVSRR